MFEYDLFMTVRAFMIEYGNAQKSFPRYRRYRKVRLLMAGEDFILKLPRDDDNVCDFYKKEGVMVEIVSSEFKIHPRQFF